jgi:hypothetical protein
MATNLTIDESVTTVNISGVTETTPAYTTITLSNDQGPQGPTGATGPAGPANTLSIGTVTGGASAAATITGTAPTQTLNLTLPKGDTGNAGPANSLSIGTVSEGTAAATITGTAPSQTLNLTVPKGNTGTAATIAVGTVTTGAAGSSATVTNSGSSSAATFDFSIPRGNTGATGARGRGYDLTSNTSRAVNVGSTVIFTTFDKDGNSSQGAYFAGAQIIGFASSGYYFYGNIGNLVSTIGINVNVETVSVSGGFSASSWNFQITGAKGQTGDTGPSGVIGVDGGELTNTGDSTSAQLGLADVGTAGIYTKVTTDQWGRVADGTTLDATDIPNLSAAKITSGSLDIARGGTNVTTGLTVLNGANLTAATVTSAKLASVTGTGTAVVTDVAPVITNPQSLNAPFRFFSGPTAVTTTITGVALLNGLVSSGPTSSQNTALPTATLLNAVWIPTTNGYAVEWSYANTGTASITVTDSTASTNQMASGYNATIAAGTSGRFLTRKTGTSSYVTYRLA